ncbi:hypothetical protein [Catenuloplanes japonicus]|uniref:hypothetical protein n=1 Tax=Catenuloplanes japonicus TaxID=33876 RepID=UPI0012FA5785|nr:hypothetical protein [Catenuloplanes japonicus]
MLKCDQLASVKEGSPVTVGGRTGPDKGLVGPWSRTPCVWHGETVRRGHRDGGGYVDWRTDVAKGDGDRGIYHGGVRVEVAEDLARQGLFVMRAPMIARSHQDNGRERDGLKRPYSVAEDVVRPDVATIVTGTLLIEPDGTRRLIRGGWADGTAEGDPDEVRGRFSAYRRRLLIVGLILVAAAGPLTTLVATGTL